MANTKAKQKDKTPARRVPKTVQQSIPYDTVYPNGIIRSLSGRFSKSYELKDVNFETADQASQEQMYLDYEGLLNSIDSNMVAEITIFNRSIDPAEVKNKILLRPKNDQFNNYRNIYNSVLIDKMNEGRNNLKKDKIFTISLAAQNIEDATNSFKRIDSDVSSRIARINKQETDPMTIEGRLGLLYDILNCRTDLPWEKKSAPLMNEDGKINLAALNGAGLSTKDLIGPDSMMFSGGYFMIGNMYCRSLFLDNLPQFLNAKVLNELSDLPCNMITSVIYTPIPTDKAALMVKHQITNINENIIRAQKKAAQGNYDSSIIPSEMQRAKEEAETLREDMQSRNQKLFKVSVVFVIMADSKEELDQMTESLKATANTYPAAVKALTYQQEAGFRTVLPFAEMDIKIDRVLNTEASAVFMPFAVQELSQDHGIYYGLNAISKNLIIYDRLSSDNYNGLILGKPGSGKSFIAKMEIINTLLSTDDDVFVIDPEGEYRPLADHFNGQVIKIAIGSDTHINPLDMDVQYAGVAEDPIAMKCDFLISICETIVGHGNLNTIMKNIIHRCGRKIYRPYYEHMRTVVNQRDANGNRITCDRTATPTLVDFYTELINQNDPNAQALASAMEMYCIGNYDLFAKQTNVDTSKRLIIYDIKDIGSGMKELAMQICLNDIWNRIIGNKKKNKKTWFYIDEFYLLTQTASSAQYLANIYRRARKWGGIPTGISQTTTDILTNEDARIILSNCNFLLLLNQSQIDRAALADLYGISDSLQDYITDKPSGTGLLYTGKTIVPFINQFPKDNELYKIMSTKATEEDKSENTEIVI